MKNKINLFFASCLTFSLILYSFSAEKEEKVAETFFKIKGVVSSNDKNQEDVVVRLYKRNQKVDSTYTAKSGKFFFELERNTHYMIELEKYGFEKSRVKVDTHRKGISEENEGNRYDLAIDIEIFSEIADKKGSEEDKDILDFPIAMIEYNNKEDAFVANTKYTKYVKGEIKKIKGSVSSK
jgi:hypothetical protein